MSKNKWMQDVKQKKGALHKQLKVPMDKKIPVAKMEKAKKKAQKDLKKAKSSSAKKKDRKTISRVTLAQNYRKAN